FSLRACAASLRYLHSLPTRRSSDRSEPVELPAEVVDHLCLLVDDSIALHEFDLHLVPRDVLEVEVGESSAESVDLLAEGCPGGERVRMTHGLSFRWVGCAAAAEDIHAIAHRPGRW